MVSFRIYSVRLLASICAFASLCTFAAAQRAVLTPHVPQLVKEGRSTRVATVDASQRIQLVLSLPLRNQDALNTLLADLYNPASPSYHQWLQPADFDARFGPTYDDYANLVAWARGNGLDVIAKSGNKRVLTVAGSTGLINRAFHVQLNTYRDNVRNRDFIAPDREPTTDLSIPLLSISGLDTANPRVNHHMKKPAENLPRYVALRDSLTVQPRLTGSGPSGYYNPSDMRAAYYGSGPLTGSGQNVGIFSYDGYYASDVALWYTTTGVTPSTIPVTNVLTGGFSGACQLNSPCDDGEQVLDILQVQGMAPGLSHIYFYEGLSAVTELNQMVSDNLVSVISSSWGGGDFGPGCEPALLQMAAQGQTFLNATGDDGAYNGFTYLPPSSDPYIAQVGGTVLTTASAGGAWASETGWTYAGGGFFDPFITIPSWQQTSGVITSTNKGSTTLRNSPDFAAEADFDNTTASNGTFETGFGGTSFAAPRLAGYIALANQQSAANGTGRLGFINPTLYELGLRSTYYHDINSGSNPAYIFDNGVKVTFPAVAGYDLVTGWGSPNGPALLNALTGPNFSMALSTSAVALVRGSSTSVSLTVSPVNNFSGTPVFTVAGLPTGLTATVTSTGTNAYSLTLTADSTAAFATTTITVTATYGSITHTATVAVSTGKRAGYDFTLSATAAMATQQSFGNSIVTVQQGAGYSGPVDLTVSNLPAGVTAVFGTPSTTTTSNLTFYPSISSAPGTYTVLLTGNAAGLVTHSIPVTINITGIASVLSDGDFESATSPWVFTSTTAGAGYLCNESCGYFQHGGSNFAYLNGFGATDTDTLSQSVRIPVGNGATLNFWLKTSSRETTTTTQSDKLVVSVINSGGTSTTVATFSNLTKNNAYVLYSYDLSAFVGQTVTLKFTGTENNSRATAFLLDDISVVVK